eukprot:TRINITY_DN6253_c0_g2_i2.p1 TRINITY_DN6253_c0_g2~~TRINITY_DN6253_c0_g2_i2.p1  ORF type:complete len:213 (-),score=25.70 TRINITY_DN6253_c0_g2_i2:41-679(-)
MNESYIHYFQKHINFSDSALHLSIACILFNPIFWNIVARAEYYTHFLTKLFLGNAKAGCYFLAFVIFSLGLLRDYTYQLALETQPKIDIPLDDSRLFLVANALKAIGLTLVLSSFYRLGITGTFLGDYFGILMKEKVTGFPFNLTDNPMYNGSTLIFLGYALAYKSFAGILLTALVFLIYTIATHFFEGPFTTMIYSKRKTNRPRTTKKKRS